MNAREAVYGALRVGDVTRARGLLDGAGAALDGGTPDDVALEARVLVREGRSAEALELLARVSDLDGPEVALARIEAQLEAGDASEAVRGAEALCARAPNEARAWLALGRALHRSGDSLRAVRELRRACELAREPGVEADAQSSYGGALLSSGRISDAEGALTRALACEPRSVAAKRNLAALRAHEGRYGDVVALLAPLGEETFRLDPALVAGLCELLDRAHEALREPRARALREAIALRADTSGPAPREPRVPAARTRSAPRGGVLDRLGRDLVALAKRGALDAVYGRERELDAVIDVLLRKKKANPVLVGPAGAGKTAVVELLAQRIARGDVPPRLRASRVVEVSTADLLAGSAFRGELEARVTQLVEELAHDRRTILFVDEVHTLVGAGTGGSAGQGLDVVEALKPALARGDISLIGATTAEDYERSIARDPALARRLSRVSVDPPGENEAIAMLRAAADDLGAHHGVRFDDGAIVAAVRLADRFVPERAHPDKGVEVLDGAGVRAVRAAKSRVSADEVCASVATLARVSLHTVSSAWGEGDAARASRDGLANVAAQLRSVVLGHDEACARVAEALLLRAVSPTANAASRPRGVFALAGPAGVGKRTLARTLARALRGDALEDSGDPRGFLRVDMSMLAERHELARLLGAPAGYAGFGEGGWLTRALREQPAAVVLLDAPERAHPDALALFASVFDSGRLVDGRGVAVDARQAVFLLAIDLEHAARAPGFVADGARGASPREARVRAQVSELLGPSLAGRLDAVLAFEPLATSSLEALAERWLSRALRALEREHIEVCDDDVSLAALVDEARRAVRPARALATLLEERVVLPAIRATLERAAP